MLGLDSAPKSSWTIAQRAAYQSVDDRLGRIYGALGDFRLACSDLVAGDSTDIDLRRALADDVRTLIEDVEGLDLEPWACSPAEGPATDAAGTRRTGPQRSIPGSWRDRLRSWREWDIAARKGGDSHDNS